MTRDKPSQEATQAIDEIVDRVDAAGLGAFVPASYREERAARTKKVPLLEYLDKLEATAKAADGGRWTGAQDWGPRAHQRDAHILATQPKATLALIAKLRDVLALVHAGRSLTLAEMEREYQRIMMIEVPE